MLQVVVVQSPLSSDDARWQIQGSIAGEQNTASRYFAVIAILPSAQCLKSIM